MRRAASLASLLAGATLAGCAAPRPVADGPRPVAALPDISAMAWMSGDQLLVVHDAKRKDDEHTRPRVGLVWMPDGSAGVRYLPVEVDWPASVPSHDLESIARIPGTARVLLAESGDDGTTDPRIFLVELRGTTLTLLESVPWPEAIYNVEATAIVEVGGQLLFVYAERNHDGPATAIHWAPLRLDPIRFGTFEAFRFPTPDRDVINRGVVALDADSSGRLFAAGSFDPDVDSGPFRSRIYRLGQFHIGSDGRIRYDQQPPEQLFAMDGIKIEALAIRTATDGTLEIIYGTDDEYYGGIVRLLRLNHD